MLNDYPTYFNNNKILNPTSWVESFNQVKNVYTTEGGTDSVALVRTRKLEVEATYRCTDKWAKIFERYSFLYDFTLRRYDVYEEDYQEITVRMEDLKIERLKNSESIQVSNGLYAVSFKLVQF